jgi:hypothetical protein
LPALLDLDEAVDPIIRADSASTRFPLRGRPQAVRGSETEGGSRKSKEVPIILLTSKNGVGWQVAVVRGISR